MSFGVEKVYRRNNSYFKTFDSRLVIEVNALKAIHVMPAFLLQKPKFKVEGPFSIT